MREKPIIGITSTVLDIELEGEINPSVQANHQYVKTVIEIGGIPIVIPVSNEEVAKECVDICDGIIFTSGEDVHPTNYDQAPSEEIKQMNIARDETEITLVKHAVEKGIPLLGTCRGLGIINVSLGGTMKQDIEQENDKSSSHNQEASRKIPSHKVQIKEDSHLFQLINEKEVKVNSKHHQAVDELADCLRVAATADDDIIEAVEAKDKDKFILGLQFHPEELYASDTGFLNLLLGFRRECEKQMKKEKSKQ